MQRALLIGVNYPGTRSELRGCVNDVYNMMGTLVEEFQFSVEEMVVLVDAPHSADETTPEAPTGESIKRHLSHLVAASQPGDILFLHFSGHGTQVPDKDGGEPDKHDEAIVPCDMNLITDDDLRALLAPLKPGVKFTMVSDCCHSGSMLDHPQQQIFGDYEQEGADDGFLASFFRGAKPEDGINRSMPLESLCRNLSEQTGADVEPTNLHHAMHAAFGDFASATSLKSLGVLDAIKEKMNTASDDSDVKARVIGEGLMATAASFLQSLFVEVEAPGEEDAAEEGPLGESAQATGVLVTGCQSHETSADYSPTGDAADAYGALTHTLTTALRQLRTDNGGAGVPHKDLVLKVRDMLHRGGFQQNPCLECEPNMVEQPFIM